jgi:hypothetical protein
MFCHLKNELGATKMICQVKISRFGVASLVLLLISFPTHTNSAGGNIGYCGKAPYSS